MMMAFDAKVNIDFLFVDRLVRLVLTACDVRVGAPNLGRQEFRRSPFSDAAAAPPAAAYLHVVKSIC